MHPSIRILSCATFIVFASAAAWPQLALFGILLLAISILPGKRLITPAVKMLTRLRWLLLSIVILSSWFTPGELVMPAIAGWSPTYEGVLFGLQRVVVLAEIILAVNILLVTTATEKLVPGLYFILWPVSLLGVQIERVSLRIAMTLEEVRNPTMDFKSMVDKTSGQKALSRAVTVVTGAYKACLQDTAVAVSNEITIDTINRPAFLQWLLFCIIVMLLYFTTLVS